VGNELLDATMSPDGRWVVTGTNNGYACKVWDARSGRHVQDIPARMARPAFSPDGRWLVIGTFEKYEFRRLEGDRWQSIRSSPREKGAAGAGLVAFAPDTGMMALTDSLRSIRLLDPRDGRELATISAPDSEELTWLCFSPDGRRLAAGTQDGAIQLWDLQEIRARLRGMGLDWDSPWPSVNGQAPSAGSPGPAHDQDASAPKSRSYEGRAPDPVEVDLGEVLDLARESLVLAVCPFDAEAYFRRGVAQARRDRLREALDDFRRVLALKPDHIEAHYRRGWVLARQGKHPEAIAAWSRAIALRPDHAEALAGRGDALLHLDRRDDAAEDYARVVELRPDWPEGLNEAAWLLATHPDPLRREIGRAVMLARKVVELEPDGGVYQNTLGVALHRAGDWPGAIEALERSAELQSRTS
jgi:Flp pilus assembly protein TadD